LSKDPTKNELKPKAKLSLVDESGTTSKFTLTSTVKLLPIPVPAVTITGTMPITCSPKELDKFPGSMFYNMLVEE